jgi:hypothetical protein
LNLFFLVQSLMFCFSLSSFLNMLMFCKKKWWSCELQKVEFHEKISTLSKGKNTPCNLLMQTSYPWTKHYLNPLCRLFDILECNLTFKKSNLRY